MRVLRLTMAATAAAILAGCGDDSGSSGKDYAKIPEACELVRQANAAELLPFEATLVSDEPVTREARSGTTYTSACDIQGPGGGVAPLQVQIFDRHPKDEAPVRDSAWLTRYAEGLGGAVGKDAELLTLAGKPAVFTPMGPMDTVFVLVSGGNSDINVVARGEALDKAGLVALAEALARTVD